MQDIVLTISGRLMAELLIDPIAMVFIAAVVILIVALLSGGWLLRLLSGSLVAGLLIAGAPSIVNPLLEIQENQIVASDACEQLDAPLVVLSGGVSSRVESVDDLSRVYEATFVRMVEAIDVIEEQADNHVIYLVGGSQRNGIAEADVMRTFFIQAGIDSERLVLERKSSNTAASAQKLMEMFKSASERSRQGNSSTVNIRLLTSALHMVRSAAVFRVAGFDVCPIPVGHKAIPDVAWWRLIPQTTALRKFDELLHEWIGLVYYRMKGFID